MNIRKAVAATLGAALIAAPALVLGQEQSIKGVIVSRKDSSIVVRAGGVDRTVTLTPETKIRGTQGAGVLRRESHPASDLIRGLAVDVNATPGVGTDLTATSIEFKTSDLRTARQIAGGISETEANVAANKAAIAEQEARLNNVGKLVAAGRAKVFFPVGGYALSDEGKVELQSLASKAKALPYGYRLAVVGRADPTGNAAANQRLSQRRAAAVKAYLLESCGVLPGNIVPDTALGENPVVNDPDPPKTAAEARRVTVTIMVSGANAPTG